MELAVLSTLVVDTDSDTSQLYSDEKKGQIVKQSLYFITCMASLNLAAIYSYQRLPQLVRTLLLETHIRDGSTLLGEAINELCISWSTLEIAPSVEAPHLFFSKLMI